MKSVFDHPEARDLFSRLVDSLGAESDRGVIIIGSAEIDSCLESALRATFRDDLERSIRTRIFSYPGPLSSSAAKADLLFALGIVTRPVYDSLLALRRLRNIAAHEASRFRLEHHESACREICGLGQRASGAVRILSLELLFKSKLALANDALEKLRAAGHEVTEAWTMQKLAEFIHDKPDIMRSMEHQLLHWELLIAVSIVGAMVILDRDRAVRRFRTQGTSTA